MPLDRIITDPIISTENTAFSPSHSRPPVEHLPIPAPETASPTERDPLVGAPKAKKPFYRARPLWLVPFALTASITRGMTLAPRVEVFTELSCLERMHDDYNHTTVASNALGFHTSVHHSLDPAGPSFNPIYLSLPPQSLKESEGDGETEGDDPRVIPGKRCVSDPAVQARAARLQSIMTTTMGALSALTTGWWGQFGERYGRTRVLALSTLGMFLTDLTFILVSTPHSPLAVHSHKLLIIAPIIEGSLGGWSSLTGANSAYIADCTSPGSRSTIFARFTGVLFVGLAVGPIIGAWLIRNPLPFLKVGTIDHPMQSVNSVFWVAIACSLINLILVLFIFPESLPAARRAANRKGKNRAVEGCESGSSDKEGDWAVVRIVRSFFDPLAMFLPSSVPIARGVGGEAPGQSRTRKDWSLTFLALALFFHMLASGLFQIKYLYAEHIYDWTAEQLSYYISFMGAARASHLLFLLPFILSTFKPVRAAVSSAVSGPANPNAPKAKPKPSKSHLFSEIRFDLLVVRCSMLLDFCSHAAVVLAPLPANNASSAWWSQVMFVGATSLACAGAGVMPALQSLALCTLQGRTLAEKEEAARLRSASDIAPVEQDAEPEPGKLFGALAVLQATGQTIIGPMVFGVIYSNTVASFPKAIFAAAGGLVLLSITLTLFVRPDVSLSVLRKSGKVAKTKPCTSPTSSKSRRRREEENRGRSRVSKDLRGGAAPADYGAMRYDASVSRLRSEAGSSVHAGTSSSSS
ncbi:hypothetical protein HYDPIDRAFT_26293 [Hydnomerulius pinastri MD-312]|nr:hypothetical protein HYDPIDRAFT_26293 [Hydnomerulius pinastri MD-312]